MKKTCLLVALLFCWAAHGGAAGLVITADDMDFDMASSFGKAKGHVVIEDAAGRAVSDYAEYSSKQQTGFLQGNVVAERDGYRITAEKLYLHSSNHISAVGSACLQRDGRILQAPQVDYLKNEGRLFTAAGRALLKDTDGSEIKADVISYLHGSGLAEANGAVEIQSEVRNLSAVADRAVYCTGGGDGYLELIGNAKATQDGNTVRGQRLRLTNTKLAQLEGGVEIEYTPKEQA